MLIKRGGNYKMCVWSCRTAERGRVDCIGYMVCFLVCIFGGGGCRKQRLEYVTVQEVGMRKRKQSTGRCPQSVDLRVCRRVGRKEGVKAGLHEVATFAL